MVTYANTRHWQVSYQTGNRVLLASRHLSPEFLGGPKKKLSCVYVGPFTALLATNNTVTLDIPPKFPKIHPTINVEYVRPYYPQHDWQQTELVLRLVVGREEQHVIDFVLAWHSSANGSNPEYLVCWKGYDTLEDSWEQSQNIDPVTLAAFDNIHPAFNARLDDLTAMLDACPGDIPQPFSAQGNVVGQDTSQLGVRAWDFFGPRTTNPLSCRVLVVPDGANPKTLL